MDTYKKLEDGSIVKVVSEGIDLDAWREKSAQLKAESAKLLVEAGEFDAKIAEIEKMEVGDSKEIAEVAVVA
jgi:hypothetical protein